MGPARPTVLIVDDDEGVRGLVAGIVGRFADVVTATDGRAALELLPADLVITDLSMPVLDGLGLIVELRARYPGIPVLLMSGSITDDEAAASGADAVVRKPFELEGFLATVKRLLAPPDRWRDISDVPVERDADRVRERLEQVTAFPVLRPAALRLMALSADDEVPIAELVRTIESDPALAALLLRVCRTPIYAGRAPIDRLDQAVMRIGLAGVRVLSVVGSLTGLSCGALDPRRFWSHSIAAASIARSTAGGLHPDTAFLAGLLHDVGKLLLCACFPDDYAALLERARRRDVAISTLERRAFGLTHEEAGATAMRAWGVGGAVADAVASHHDGGPIRTANVAAKAAGFTCDDSDMIEAQADDAVPDAVVESAVAHVRELRRALDMDGGTVRERALCPVTWVGPPGGALARYLRGAARELKTADAASPGPRERALIVTADLRQAAGRITEHRRRYVVLAPERTPRAELLAARAAGVRAVSLPVSVAELGRCLRPTRSS